MRSRSKCASESKVFGCGSARERRTDAGCSRPPSAPAVEEAVIALTDDQGDVLVEPVNTEHPLLEFRTEWKTRAVAEAKPARSPSAKRSALSAALTLQLLPSPKVVTVDTEPRRDH